MSPPIKSARRTADFKAIARDLVQTQSPTLSSDIARALEQAYSRGFIEATAGAPPEFDTSETYPWLQIPARTRGLFARWCRHENWGRSRLRAKPFLVFLYKQYRVPGMPDQWVGFELQAEPKDYKKCQLDYNGGRTTIQQLLDRKLMARFIEDPDMSYITDYGLDTYAHAVRDGFESD